MEILIEGQTLQQVDYVILSDKKPVYVQFPKDSGFESQWGIVDRERKITIHKDFTLRFSKKLKYFVIKMSKNKSDEDNLIKLA